MIANSYHGMVQPQVPRLIVSRARRLRVGRDEIDDLQQQIVPLLAGFRFDPARANGATPATAMTSVIDRKICQDLSHGLSVTAIAQQLGCGRDTIDRAVVRIRKVFETAGLRAWIDPDYRRDGQHEQGRAQ